jgi:hypothetical protein
MYQQGYEMKFLPTKTQKFEKDVLLEAAKFKSLMDPQLYEKIFQVSLSLLTHSMSSSWILQCS